MEYKQYVILGYLKKMSEAFEAQRLYPAIESWSSPMQWSAPR